MKHTDTLTNFSIENIILWLKKQPFGIHAVGASTQHLDRLESRLKVELPPSIRKFLQYDFTFKSFGPTFRGTGRLGKETNIPHPKVSTIQKCAEAMVDLGWTEKKIHGRVLRLPNLPKQPWNVLYLGESRKDGELLILGLKPQEKGDSLIRVYPRYTSFVAYLGHQLGLIQENERIFLDGLEEHIDLNSKLRRVFSEEANPEDGLEEDLLLE